MIYTFLLPNLQYNEDAAPSVRCWSTQWRRKGAGEGSGAGSEEWRGGCKTANKEEKQQSIRDAVGALHD